MPTGPARHAPMPRESAPLLPVHVPFRGYEKPRAIFRVADWIARFARPNSIIPNPSVGLGIGKRLAFTIYVGRAALSDAGVVSARREGLFAARQRVVLAHRVGRRFRVRTDRRTYLILEAGATCGRRFVRPGIRRSQSRRRARETRRRSQVRAGVRSPRPFS